MKKVFTLILSAVLLASSVISCGKSGTGAETTNTAETQVYETSVAETDSAETETPTPVYSIDKLTENGTSLAHIVLFDGAEAEEKTAAEELAYHIKLISNAEVSVTNAVQDGSLPIIIATPLSYPAIEELFPEDLAWLRTLEEETEDGVRTWGEDGFAVRVLDGKIYIFGANAKGALNGTYDFIEENMDVLWPRIAEEEAVIYHENPTITLTKTDYREKSPFKVRGWHLSGTSDQAAAQPMLARNKLNTLSGTPSEEYGISRFPVAHNIKQMVLSSPLYDPEEREYWNTDGGGTFLSPQFSPQINFWSDKAAEAIAASVIAYVRDGSDISGIYGGDQYIFIGIEDVQNGYTNPFENEPFEYAPGQFVDPSDPRFMSTVYYTFMNKVARMVAEECPDTVISTFAYYFTTNAPYCEIEDNLFIVMATISEDLNSPLTDGSHWGNRNLFKTLEQWREVTTNMVFYNYYGCFIANERYSRPIWDTIQEHLQYYAASGFYGVQPEGNGDDEGYKWGVFDLNADYQHRPSDSVPNSVTWDMNGMTYWIFSKLAWDPYEDVDALIKRYCDMYYGGASDYMQEYYYLLEAGWNEGRKDLMHPYEWYTGFDVYLESFICNPFFEENVDLHEKILTALDNAWNAANDVEKERIRYIKETMEENISFYFD